VAIVCAGKEGVPSLEDLVCAGLLVEKLRSSGAPSPAKLGRGAEEAVALYRAHRRDLGGMLAACEHGRYLASIGMGRDVPYCAQLDLFDLVPRLVGGVIRCRR
jgi:2-phosphosulfolactate phosphatase